jgi:NTP pyrophosphatase (non-canonical NTP hydrolase)
MAVLAAFVAGLVALTGFLVNGSLTRATEKRKACAEALKAVERYAQLPYSFSRRPDDTPATLRALAELLADVQIELAFHQRWLQLENEQVAKRYEALVAKIQVKNSGYRKQALAGSPVDKAASLEIGHPYRFGAEGEWAQCIAAMRGHVHRRRLRFWAS